MILPAILLAFASACTPDGIDREQPDSTSCEAGFVLDGSVCVPASCGTGQWGDLPVDDDTVYVDVTAGEGGDGTEEAPFDSSQAGLDRAGVMGGGLVAVAAGIYPETLAFTTDHADVHLAGRCREMVTLDASVGDEETPGIEIDGGYGAVEVSGVTVRDSQAFGLLMASGELLVRDAAVLGGASRGVEAYHPNLGGMTVLVMEGCLIEGTIEVGILATDPGTQITLRDTKVRDVAENTTGEYGRGIQVQDGATLVAESCLIEGNTEYGLSAEGSGTQIVLRDTSVRDTRPKSNGDYGRGIFVMDGVTLSAEGCIVEGNADVGVLAASPDTQVTLLGTTVRDTHPDANGQGGWGIFVLEGASLVAEGCLVEGNTLVGVHGRDPGSALTLRDTSVMDTHPDAKGEGGWGMAIDGGAMLQAEGCLVEGNSNIGVLSVDAGTQAILVDSTVKDTRPSASGDYGRGVVVQEGATLSAEGCVIAGNSELGAFADGPDTQMLIRDSIIRDTRPSTEGGGGWGVQASNGASLGTERVVIQGNGAMGISVGGQGTRATLWDTIVRDTQPEASGQGGRGIEVDDGAELAMEGCLVDGNANVGVIAGGLGTRVHLRDTVVRETQPNPDGRNGRGIAVQQGATLFAEGCLVEGSTEVGLIAIDPGTQVTLVETIVEDTRSNASGEGGWGFQVSNGATLSAEGCLMDGNIGLGLAVASPGTRVSLVDSTVTDTRLNAEGDGGWGIQVIDAATLSMDGGHIDASNGVGLVAADPGTQVNIRDSTVSITRAGVGLACSAAFGVIVQLGAFMAASHLDILSNEGPGLLVNGAGSDLTCSECLIRGNQFAGAVVLAGGTLAIHGSTIEGTSPGTNLLGGTGVYAWPWLGAPPALTVTETVIRDNPVAGVWFIGNGNYVLTDNTISGGTGEPYGAGFRCGDAILARDGVTAWDGTSGLLLEDNELLDASGSGIFLDESSALMSGNTYAGNSRDLVVQNQSCDPIPSWYSEAPQRDLCPFYSYPTCYAEFFFVAMPAEPVGWEEDKAALHPRFLRMDHIARPLRSIHPITVARAM